MFTLSVFAKHHQPTNHYLSIQEKQPVTISSKKTTQMTILVVSFKSVEVHLCLWKYNLVLEHLVNQQVFVKPCPCISKQYVFRHFHICGRGQDLRGMSKILVQYFKNRRLSNVYKARVMKIYPPYF